MNEFSYILQLIQEARNRALQNVNRELVTLYFNIGKIISEKVASGSWGEKTVDELASYILLQDPELKGFNRRGLYRMRQFFETYRRSLPESINLPKTNKEFVSPAVTQISEKTNISIVSPLVTQIPWSHNLLILSKTKSLEEKLFYINMVIENKLTRRQLEREIDSGKYERTIIAGRQLPLINHPEAGKIKQIFKDTYITEFLDLPEPHSERELQKALVKQMKKFIIELGSDFLFVGEEFRLQVGLHDYSLDLLFYHRDLHCLVAFELKIEEFKPEHLGKLNFYLEALDRDVKKLQENPSIGVLLCKTKDSEVVEYTMSRNMSPALIAEYQTKLPDKQILEHKIHELLQVEFNNGD